MLKRRELSLLVFIIICMHMDIGRNLSAAMTETGETKSSLTELKQRHQLKSPGRTTDLYALWMILVAISSTVAIIIGSLQLFQNELVGCILFSGSNLVGLMSGSFIEDFVAANHLIYKDTSGDEELSARLFRSQDAGGSEQQPISDCNQSCIEYSQLMADDGDDLPPVSLGGWRKSKLKRLLQSGHHSFNQIPDYPLDQQPDPERITHIDADLRSCLGPARAQLGCGACYAFSWNSLLEWHYCKQTGEQEELLDLSEQHIIDCSNFGGFDRCEAGRIMDVKVFTEEFGLYLEQDYPYTAKYRAQSIEKCKGGTKQFRTTSWTRLIVDRKEWEQVLREQPILVQAHLPSNIKSHKGGIHPGDNCNDKLLHGMLLVGHGREEGKPYWLIRNSMGAKWGESGHFRLARNDSTMSQCFATGWVGKFKFDSIDTDKYDEFYSRIKFEPSEHILKGRSTSG